MKKLVIMALVLVSMNSFATDHPRLDCCETDDVCGASAGPGKRILGK